MFINDRRIWGLTLTTRIFRGWNLRWWQAVLSSKRCNGVSCGSAGAGDSTIFFPFWIAFNRNILYKWEICHGQVWLRQLVNVCVDIAPTCSKLLFSDRGPLKSAASNLFFQNRASKICPRFSATSSWGFNHPLGAYSSAIFGGGFCLLQVEYKNCLLLKKSPRTWAESPLNLLHKFPNFLGNIGSLLKFASHSDCVAIPIFLHSHENQGAWSRNWRMWMPWSKISLGAQHQSWMEKLMSIGHFGNGIS